MKAFILAGGKGKRLRPYTLIIPKPLLPINGKPILELLLEDLAEQGVDEAIISINYKSDFIKEFLKKKKINLKIKYLEESKPLGTIGSLKKLQGYFDSCFLVINSDIIAEVNFNELFNFHKKNNADLTIATKKIEIPIDYGAIELKGDDVIRIEEKPVITKEINTGIYIFSPKIIALIPEDSFFDVPQLINLAIKNKMIVRRFPLEGDWKDIGKLEDFNKLLMKE